MPIYLNEVTTPCLPTPAMDALVTIANAATDRVVTPGIAMGLLRTHLLPVMPERAKAVFALTGQPRWDSLLFIYAELLALSEGIDATLVAGAFVVDVVWQHSTRPPREVRYEHSIDVASFLRIAGYAKLAIPTAVRMPSGIALEPLRFCRYCWRGPRSTANVCSAHSVHGASKPAAVAQYKHAQRLRATFERNVLALSTREELEFHGSEFTAPVFFPRANELQWLAQRRPLLHAAAAPSDPEPLRDLVIYLFGGDEIMAFYAEQPHLLTVVTLRAEAWLQAVAEKGSWGGKRDTAGRKHGR